MPIRLLVAVTVGIAAFSLLVPMADRVERAERTELTVEPEQRQLTVAAPTPTAGVAGSAATDPPRTATVRIDAVTTDGKPVTGTTLVVSGRSLSVTDGPHTVELGPDKSSVILEVGTTLDADISVSFRPTQRRGTIRFEAVPPPGSEYVDELENPELTVHRAD